MEWVLPDRQVDAPVVLQTEHLRTYAQLLSRAGRTLESTIQGSSMGQTIPDGARIRIEPRPAPNYRRGQIVACLERGLLFAHRVVHVHGDALITQGDGWTYCDPPMRTSQVIGEVVSCNQDGLWHTPAESAVRSPCEAHAAARHVRVVARCLAINLGFARLVARQIIRVHIWQKHCRRWLAPLRN